MEELFWRDPMGSQRFLSGLMRAGFLHGTIAIGLMGVTLIMTWGSQASCDRTLRGWIGFQVVLQILQFPSRWSLYYSLPAQPAPPDTLTEAQHRESQQRVIDGLVALVQSRKWTVNRLFGLLALGWFLVGVWWTLRAQGCDYSPVLYNVCITLLALFCTRTVFVFVWFTFIFGQNSNQQVGYAGPFRKPGASLEMLSRLDACKFCDSEVANEKELQCSICLCEFEGEEEVRRLPCKHYFHRGCIDGWLRISRACPMCNTDIAKALDAPIAGTGEGQKAHAD